MNVDTQAEIKKFLPDTLTLSFTGLVSAHDALATKVAEQALAQKSLQASHDSLAQKLTDTEAVLKASKAEAAKSKTIVTNVCKLVAPTMTSEASENELEIRDAVRRLQNAIN